VLQQMAVSRRCPARGRRRPRGAGDRALAARLPADETQLLYSIVLHGRAELPLAPTSTPAS
jgi:DNA polymerase-3 subunit gamma/tau